MAKSSVPPPPEFVRNIRALLQARGLSEAEAARKAGLPQRTGARVLTGEGDPQLSSVVAILKALDVELRELYRPSHEFTRLLDDGALAGWHAAPTAGTSFEAPQLLHLVSRLTRAQWNALVGALDDLPGHPKAIEDAAPVATAILASKHAA